MATRWRALFLISFHASTDFQAQARGWHRGIALFFYARCPKIAWQTVAGGQTRLATGGAWMCFKAQTLQPVIHLQVGLCAQTTAATVHVHCCTAGNLGIHYLSPMSRTARSKVLLQCSLQQSCIVPIPGDMRTTCSYTCNWGGQLLDF